jgi:hypothetical protein
MSLIGQGNRRQCPSVIDGSLARAVLLLGSCICCFGSGAEAATALGCYNDTDTSRTLAFSANDQACIPTEGGNDQESCRKLCCSAGFGGPTDLMGVEYGCQCFCGHQLDHTPAKLPATDCQAMQCPGNNSEFCGDGDRLLVFKTGNCSVCRVFEMATLSQ